MSEASALGTTLRRNSYLTHFFTTENSENLEGSRWIFLTHVKKISMRAPDTITPCTNHDAPANLMHRTFPIFQCCLPRSSIAALTHGSIRQQAPACETVRRTDTLKDDSPKRRRQPRQR